MIYRKYFIDEDGRRLHRCFIMMVMEILYMTFIFLITTINRKRTVRGCCDGNVVTTTTPTLTYLEK